MSTDDVTLDLDALEREDAPKPFKTKLSGKTYLLKSPEELPWRSLAGLTFAPGDLLPAVVDEKVRDEFRKALDDLPTWKVNKLARVYRTHHGIGSDETPDGESDPESDGSSTS